MDQRPTWTPIRGLVCEESPNTENHEPHDDHNRVIVTKRRIDATHNPCPKDPLGVPQTHGDRGNNQGPKDRDVVPNIHPQHINAKQL